MNIDEKLIAWRKADIQGNTSSISINELRAYADKLIDERAPKIMKAGDMLNDYRKLILSYNDVGTVSALHKKLLDNITTVLAYELDKAKTVPSTYRGMDHIVSLEIRSLVIDYVHNIINKLLKNAK